MRLPVRRITAIALVVGIAASAAAFVATSRAVDGHETQLLQQQSSAVATLVATAVQQEQQGLAEVARTLANNGAGPAPATTPAAGVAGVALLRQDGGVLQVVARSGTLLAAVPPVGSVYRAPWIADVADSLFYTGFLGQGAQRVLGLTLGFPDGEVLYGELPLAPLDAKPASSPSSPSPSPSSPFANLDFALYLGTSETAASLVMASTAQLPLSGTRATVMLTGSPIASSPVVNAARGSLPASPHQLFLVMAPHGLLGGTLDAVLAWAVLGGCLLAAGLVAGFLEVAARRRDQALGLATALRESERNFRQLFADNPQPMWAYDLETLDFLDVNEAAIQKYGYSREEFLGMRITDIRPAEDHAKLMASLSARGTRPVDSSGPWRHRLRDGRCIDVAVTSHVQDFGGRAAVLVGVRDITVERELEERLRHHALHDPLTGAGNRELLMLQLAEMLASSSATTPCALLLVDVDGMKAVNDSLGRDGADELLVAVCERLIAAAGDGAHVARLGGDVFAVTACGAADVPAARQWAEQLLAAIAEPFIVRDRSVAVSASGGLALAEPGEDERELLRNADVALQAAKEARSTGGRRIELFDPERDRARLDRLALEADLRGAVDAGQLRLFYQPLLDVATGRVTGVEALIRWEHPERGLLSPAVFLPLAERCGLMPSIDAWVIATACRQARAWLDRGLPRMTTSVNICAHDVETGPALVELVRRELQRNRLPAHCLEIELTESVALRDREEAETVLGELRELGVRVALDDFGTGYSMLDRLRDLPMDRVKIDRTFVRRATGEGATLLRAMIAMAHSLGLDAVAEGVETQQELELLTSWDCDTVQGFLISKPITAAEIEALLTTTTVTGRRATAARAAR